MLHSFLEVLFGLEAVHSKIHQGLGANMKSKISKSPLLARGFSPSFKCLLFEAARHPLRPPVLCAHCPQTSKPPHAIHTRPSSWLHLPLNANHSETSSLHSNSLASQCPSLNLSVFPRRPLPASAMVSPRTQESQAPLKSSVVQTET